MPATPLANAAVVGLTAVPQSPFHQFHNLFLTWTSQPHARSDFEINLYKNGIMS
jgi:hypothetical protein